MSKRTKKRRDLGTELCLAVFRGQPEKVEQLLAEGADVNAIADRLVPSVAGQSPLWAATMHAGVEITDEWADLCDALTEAMPSIPARGPDDNRDRYVTIVRKLIEAGANLEQMCHGSTPLRQAICNLDHEIVRLLLDKHANPNSETFSPMSNLAERDGNKTKPAYYNTVLHEAVEKNSLPIVQALVEAGANVKRTDHSGKEPLDIAHEKGFAEIEAFLSNIRVQPAR